MESNKVALVTGGTKGIGLATAIKLLNAGYKVFACSSNSVNIERAKLVYCDIDFVQCDVTSDSDVSRLFTLFSRLDVLVNNAGYLKVSPFASSQSQDDHKTMETNLFGALRCTRHALNLMSISGTVVNVLSSSIDGGRPGQSIYVASKAALAGAMMCIRKEHPHISIFDVKPRRTLTDMRLENFPGEDAADCLDPADVASSILACLPQN